MSVELAQAYVSIIAETSSIPRDIRRALGEGEREATRSGQRTGNNFAAGMSGGLKKIAGVTAAAGGVASLGAAFGAVVTSGMDFTNTLNTMRAVSSATDTQIAAVSARARQLGSDNTLTATSATDAAQAMTELAKGGFSVDQSMQAARGTLQLAAAAQISAGEAATIQSQALQSFGKDASFAGQAADILANAANQSSAEITDVAQALQQGGAVANQFGVSMQDSAATLALLANAGIKGSDAGTLMKSALLALTDTTDKQSTAAEKLGFQLDGNGVKFKGMADLFATLGSARKRLTQDEYNAASAVLFGSDAMRLAGVAGVQGAIGYDRMRDAIGKQGAAAEVAAAKTRGLPGALERLKNAGQDAALGIYDVIQGPLSQAADLATRSIGGAVDALGRLGSEGVAKLRDTGIIAQAAQTFSEVRDAVVEAAPAIGRIAASLAQAAAVVAGGAWLAFSGALQVAAGALQVISPILEVAGNLMKENQGAVTALLTAYLAFKIIPGIVGRIGTAFAPITSRVTAATASMGSFSQQVSRLQTVSAASGTGVSRLGASLAVLGTRVPAIGQMQSAFTNAAAGAERFSRTAGTVAAAGSGLRSGIGALTGALGGPLGIALAGGALALGAWAKNQADAAAAAAQHRREVDALSQAINYQTGALDAQGKKQVFDKLNSQGVFTGAQDINLGVSNAQIQSAAEGQAAALSAVNAALDAQTTKAVQNSQNWKTNASDYEKAGVSLQELTAAIRGNGPAQDSINKKLQAAGWKNYDSAVGRARNSMDGAGKTAVDLGNKIGATNDTLGESAEKARRETEALGLAGQRFSEIAKQFEAPETKSIQVDTSQIAGAEDRIKSLGFTTRSLPNGKVEITANDETARLRLQYISQNVTLLNALTANPKVGLDTQSFMLDDQRARDQLRDLSNQTSSPQAKLQIQELLNKKSFSAAELQRLNDTIAEPQVRADVAKVLQNIKLVNDALDQAARARTASITVARQIIDAGGSGAPLRPEIIAEARQGRASGGFISGPGTATSDSIPAMLSDGEFVVRASQTAKHRGLLESINRGGPVPGYATGGIVKAKDLDDLARGGFGASRPLEGADYNWGGVNWGDCSGAMSAFARFAAGLDAFGGRFATASEGSALQQMGAVTGRGTTGDLRFGWHNGGPGGGHTSGTLPSGVNVEMGGSRGNGQYGGGAAGADDGQHTNFAYFPASMFADSVTFPTDGVGTDPGGTLTRPDLATTSTTAPSTPEKTIAGSISENFGNAAGAAVSGQVSDFLKVFGISDQLAALEAIGQGQQAMKEYQDKRKRGDKTDGLTDQQKLDQKLSNDRREFDERSKQDQKLRDLKLKYEPLIKAKKPGAKEEYERKKFELEQEYKRAKFERSQQNQRAKVRDPGTDKPKPGQDLGPIQKLVGLQDQGGLIKPGLNLIANKLNKPETTLPFSPDELVGAMGQPSRGDDFSIVINNPVFSDRDRLMVSANRMQSRRSMQYRGRPR